MNDRHVNTARATETRWLMQYYFVRTAFSALWVALAFSLGRHSPGAAAALLVVYPAWDALANYVDMARSGGAAANRTQALNFVISVLTALAALVALRAGAHWVLDVFGAWAILAGLMQLGTAVRRWKDFGAQWAMILSGAQSALAGTFFIVQSNAPTPAIEKIGGYAAVGAVYFLISALWLVVSQWRRKAAQVS
ncbi:DUF308 domain-containing protein [Paraburkholderia acidisoli]|uniref:DUF308 domain-containing protein n=1 Tax=Paraburkholderia acidisoli TaxID=2571748 RepID=A0A7Z2JK29_9BURK|nr:DUF308 domain-containing protein [Paraburkholderia acidisoli]QGZ66005.1 DUF308 domain-containing protein [Paraburkholderia acidisoli]